MVIKKSLVSFLAALVWTFGFLAATTPLIAADKEKVLYSFCLVSGCADGAEPNSGLILDSAGNLYGTTANGGTTGGPCGQVGDFIGCGTVFELVRNENGGWTEKVLHTFNYDDGAEPSASLVFDGAGNLYGTTEAGGAGRCMDYSGDVIGCGTVFRLTPDSNGKWTEKVLHQFESNGKDGNGPSGSLILDASGNLYGTTGAGGTGKCPEGAAVGCGTVFQLTPGTNGQWTEKVLHSFKGGDGVGPSGVILDVAGNLFGTAHVGGAYDDGTIFELTPAANGKWTLKVLHRFGLGPDGILPNGALILDATGNLFGATLADGTPGGNCGKFGCGTVFELKPGSNGQWTEKVLHRFNGDDGSDPQGGLIFDAAGNLYGVNGTGGDNNYGTIFQLIPAPNGKWTEKVLRRFDSRDGTTPNPNLIFDANGNLYGTTRSGGANRSGCFGFGCGTVFEITP
jgi:uncharacterized repeat protein (TIGR03803 family)